ncbi:MAG: hypothetical protein K1X64_07395 [Myxococcaceae bacterium]|nr:hypothetical protein [Myxococcaceae bacterium]
MKPSFALAAALIISMSASAEKIAVAKFTGPGADIVRNQVTQVLCEDNDCVNAAKVMKGTKPDWKKAKKEKVVYVVTGKVIAKGKKRTVELQVLNKPGAPKFKKSYELDSGTLPKKMLTSAATALSRAMAAEAKEVGEPVAEAPAEEPKREPPAPMVDTSKASEPEAIHEAEPKAKPSRMAEPEPAPAEVEDAAPKKKRRAPVFSIQLGLDGFSRNLSYVQATTPNLRTYALPFASAPAAQLELFPLAVFSDGLISGLGIEAGYAMAIGLQSRREAPKAGCGVDPCPAPINYATSNSKLDVALKFRIPFGESGVAIAPHAGFRSHSFTFGKGTDGSTIDGLPSVAYSALRLGLSLDATFAEYIVAFLNFSYLPVLSSGQIISTAYFSRGSAYGLEGGAGVGFKLPFLTALQIRGAFNFTRYAMSFRPEMADAYQATGATDQYIGFNVGLRYTF